MITLSPQVTITAETDWDRIKHDVLRIEEECFDQELRYSEEDYLEGLQKQNAEFLTLRIDGVIEGFIYSGPIHSLDYLSFDPHYSRNDTLYINDIAVSTRCRNHGHATTMLRHLIAGTEYPRYSAHAISNASRRVFTKAGFHENSIYENWMGGRSAAYMVFEKEK
jgi:ribosomal protein S18 acetylase RimI-like enzyme